VRQSFGIPAIPSGTGLFGAIQSVAPTFGIEAIPINVRDADEIKRTLSAFARSGSGGLVVIPSPASFLHRDLIVALAAQFKLPAIYFLRLFVTAGGLISYGPDEVEQYRQAATYVVVFSKERSRLTFLCRPRPNTTWSST